MSPETVESRIGRLERDVALLVQRLDDLRGRVTDLALTANTVIELKVAMGNLQNELANVRRELTDRDRDAAADRRGTKTAIMGMTGAIIATIIGAVITLMIASGGHP